MHYLTCTTLLYIFKMATSNPNTLFEVYRGCWPSNIVRYSISQGFSEIEIAIIHEKISIIHNATCIRWVDLDEMELESKYSVKFVKVTGKICQAKAERHRDKIRFTHFIQVSKWCFEENFILHEMIHTMGIEHEHQRTDRDCYVDVDEDKASAGSYKIIRNNYDGGWLERFPYDKYSIMHYPRSSAMKAKSERWFDFWEPLGNEEGVMTALDVWKLLFRHCNFPHFCDVDPLYCEHMEEMEKDCIDNTPYAQPRQSDDGPHK